MSRDSRLSLVERIGSELSLSVQADLLSIGRSSLYYQPRPAREEEVALRHRIDEIYTGYPFYSMVRGRSPRSFRGMVGR